MNLAPLSERMRPSCLSEVLGQEHLTSREGLLAKAIEHKYPVSILLWGPPGCGKTTVARVYARSFDADFKSFSAVMGSIAELKQLIKEHHSHPLFRKKLIIFVDEIHRFNKAQQDAFLPYIEDGSVILIGATTENPSFALNNALLSRMRIFELKPLSDAALRAVIHRFEQVVSKPKLSEEVHNLLIEQSGGDGRHLLNLLENVMQYQGENPLTAKEALPLINKKAATYDKGGDGHYNLISALHKSVRGSDPDAALYYLCRMLEGGDDPLFIGRRLIRMALEDVGLSDPNALGIVVEAVRSYERLGSPEGDLGLAQAAVYLALAPKSNQIYLAFKKARELARTEGHIPPPKCILNGATKLMKECGYGHGYIYDHDTPQGFSGQNYFPDEMQKRPIFYTPIERGFERELKKRIEYFEKLRKKTCHAGGRLKGKEDST